MGDEWWKTGWDLDSDPEDQKFSGDKDEPRRFWMPPESTSRIMLLDKQPPFRIKEHSLYDLTRNARDVALCLADIPGFGSCPLCVANHYGPWIGVFTIVDMGRVVEDDNGDLKLQGWKDKRGNHHQFERKLYCPKKGSKDKPGVLRKMDGLRKRTGGSLHGTVWDVTRGGKLTEKVGDDFFFISQVPEDQWAAYLMEHGCRETALPTLEVFDYVEVFTHKKEDERRRREDPNCKTYLEELYERMSRLVGTPDEPQDDIPF